MSNLFEHCRGAKEVEIIKAQIVRGVFFMAHLIPFNKLSSSAELVILLRSRGLYIEEEQLKSIFQDGGVS